MLWSIFSIDNPGFKDLREKTMQAQCAYMEAKDSVLFFAGQLLNDDGDGVPVGGFWIVSANSRADASALAENAPCSKAGIYASVDICRARTAHFHPELAGEISAKPTRPRAGTPALWSAYAIDKAYTRELRKKTNPAHSAYMALKDPVLFYTGQLQTDDLGPALGSLRIVSAATAAEAQAFMDEEPYNKAGIHEPFKIYRMRLAHFHPELSGELWKPH